MIRLRFFHKKALKLGSLWVKKPIGVKLRFFTISDHCVKLHSLDSFSKSSNNIGF